MDGQKSNSAAMTISIALNLVLVIALMVLLNAYSQLQSKYERSLGPRPQSSSVDIGGYEQTESDFIPGDSFEPDTFADGQVSIDAQAEPAGTIATETTAAAPTTAQTTAATTTETTAAATTAAQTTASTVPVAPSVDDDEDSGEWLDFWSDN